VFHTIRRIHFIGIGGSGMSGLAEILVSQGYEVSGSDSKKSTITERLSEKGAHVYIGHEAKHVEKAQVVVVSSAISKHNSEWLAAVSHKIPVIHRAEMLAELMRLKFGILVAGTHGKTTTTSLLATVLQDLALDPTVVIGGKLNHLGTSAKLGEGELFLAEADESDGTFLKLSPTVAVLTNIDRDHLDHYGSLDEILLAFRAFVEKIPFYGALCACLDDPLVQGLLSQVRRKVITFGLRTDADITAKDIEFRGFETHFTPVVFGKAQERTVLRMPGRYNVCNALASYAVAAYLEKDFARVARSLSEFTGVLHRFTVLGTVSGVTIVDDYAHNPKKIATLLEGIRESFPNHFVCAVFQPHRYSRVKHQLDEFAQSFQKADAVIVTPIYSAGEQPQAGATSEILARRIHDASFHKAPGRVHTASDLSEAAQLGAQLLKTSRASDASLTQEAKGGAILVTMGAGDVRTVGDVLLQTLQGTSGS
jgi:UDP-N-acetylmuramate--alanine ligase